MRPLLVRNSQWWNFEQQSQSLKQRYRSFKLQFIRVKNSDTGVSNGVNESSNFGRVQISLLNLLLKIGA